MSNESNGDVRRTIMLRAELSADQLRQLRIIAASTDRSMQQLIGDALADFLSTAKEHA
jgi:predicted transcriptional regulator